MKSFDLVGVLREELGKKATKAARKADLVPCNLYGLGKENVVFTIPDKEAQKIVYTPDTLVLNLSLGKLQKKAVIKERQFHPVTDRILHFDFLEVDEKTPVVVEIPVKLNGLAEGVKLGGKLSLEKRKLKVKGIYTAIPEKIEIDVTSLGIGKKIAVGDIHIDGLEMMNSKDLCVAQVKATRASSAATTEQK